MIKVDFADAMFTTHLESPNVTLPQRRNVESSFTVCGLEDNGDLTSSVVSRGSAVINVTIEDHGALPAQLQRIPADSSSDAQVHLAAALQESAIRELKLWRQEEEVPLSVAQAVICTRSSSRRTFTTKNRGGCSSWSRWPRRPRPPARCARPCLS